MPAITYLGQCYTARNHELVLDCLLRHGADIPFSCRNGVCQTCLLKDLSPERPPVSNQRILQGMVEKGYFLPCKTVAIEGMNIVPPDPRDIILSATVVEVERLAAGQIRVSLEPHLNLEYDAGQAIYLRHPDGSVEAFELIENSSQSPCLVFRLDTDDGFRRWLSEELSCGDEVSVSKPFALTDREQFRVAGFSSVVEQQSEKGADRGERNLAWDEASYPPPNSALWRVLSEGNRLKNLIDDFYDIVFEDPVLSPYFHNTTKQRSKEKVYSFYKRVFSGEECYFGDRPRNAHHWMVISDEIFDHRLEILTSCMRKYGLSDEQVGLWRSYEEHYRNDIVKSEPRGRKIGDITLPAGGFDFDTLVEGSMCDSCFEPIEKETRVLYNKRTGHVYCPDCHAGGTLREQENQIHQNIGC